MRDTFKGGRAPRRATYAVAAGVVLYGLVSGLVSLAPRPAASEEGRELELAATCAACHSAEGRSGGIPSLAGSQPSEIVAALREFRAGQRSGMIMQVVAGSLTDDEIAAVAISLAGLNEAEAPQ